MGYAMAVLDELFPDRRDLWRDVVEFAQRLYISPNWLTKTPLMPRHLVPSVLWFAPRIPNLSLRGRYYQVELLANPVPNSELKKLLSQHPKDVYPNLGIQVLAQHYETILAGPPDDGQFLLAVGFFEYTSGQKTVLDALRAARGPTNDFPDTEATQVAFQRFNNRAQILATL